MVEFNIIIICYNCSNIIIINPLISDYDTLDYYPPFRYIYYNSTTQSQECKAY